MARILLVRHGRSSHTHDGRWVNAEGVRQFESAYNAAGIRDLAVSPLLRELELEPPPWVPFRLPIAAWDIFTYLTWSHRLLIANDHESLRRASAAAEWLLERAAGTATVLAVTHGGFRRILDARLTARGWTAAPGKKSYANWSTWAYSR